MTINEFIKKIEYSEDAICTYEKMHKILGEDYLVKKGEYYENEELFLQNLKEQMGENYYPAILYYFTNFAFELKDTYLKMGFTEEEYLHTFCDLKTWNEMCVLETGICGLRETGWLTSHMHAGIVRFGRMQFQPEVLEEDLVVKDTVIKAGTEILNVHIPFGGAIGIEEVQDSLNRAKAHFGEKYVHAESWLLDPTLQKYLSPTSNILSFANRFTVYKLEEHYSIERFVFLVPLENKNDYVAKNAFQQRIKDALIRGEKFYSGYGVMKL